MQTQSFDLVVIGTGSAGASVASACRTAGWEVAVVDSLPFGGTCALRGCDPKKVLVGAAEAVDWVRRMKGQGIRAEGVGIDWQELMRFKRTFTDPVPGAREASLAKAGIRAFHGRARFTGPGEIQAGDATLKGRFVVIATGARPADLDIPGEEHVVTSDQFLELERLPERILFIGGGFISFEFAHVAARAGAQVTILHRGPRPLTGFDPDLVDHLVKQTREIGVELELGTAVNGIDKSPRGFTLRATHAGKARNFEADLIVHGAGRTADIDDLDLETGGVKRTRRGVAVNEYLQSVSNPRVYAAGDAASAGPPLTPVAGYDGSVVADNLLKGNRRKAEYAGVPSVVFTTPPMASVGLHEAAAREQGLKFRVHLEDRSTWYSSRRMGETASASKVLIDEASGKIIGAHLFGAHAEEIINLFVLAIRAGIPASDLKTTWFSYPSHGSDLAYML